MYTRAGPRESTKVLTRDCITSRYVGREDKEMDANTPSECAVESRRIIEARLEKQRRQEVERDAPPRERAVT